MMFFLTLYCGRAEILIEDVSSVILLNTVHFPNWNMTLSQKIALNFCHFFLPVFVSFFVISLSVRKYWLRELWIKKKDWGFFPLLEPCCGQSVLPLPWALFHALPSTDFWHLQWLLGVGLWQLSLPVISWGSWPPQLSWALLMELGWSPQGQGGPSFCL